MRDVAQPFEQRHVGALGLRQHAAVEGQDGLLAVQQAQQRAGATLAWPAVVSVSELFGHALSL